MSRLKADEGDSRQALRECWAVNGRMMEMVLENLDSAAWRSKPPGSKGRTIAAIVAHVHNMRRKWIRLSAPHLKLPAALDRAGCTRSQARAALKESAACCSEMLAWALGGSQGQVKNFRRDGWAKPWPAGAAMVAFMITHEAHHRGQVCMLAHQLGFPLPVKAGAGMWVWEKLWKDCGFGSPR